MRHSTLGGTEPWRSDRLRAGQPNVQAFLERAYRDSDDVRTTTAVVAQTWHGDPRQARLARLLRGVHERELTSDGARVMGRLLRRAGMADVVDGTLIEIARDGDEVLTSDADDIRKLAIAANKLFDRDAGVLTRHLGLRPDVRSSLDRASHE